MNTTQSNPTQLARRFVTSLSKRVQVGELKKTLIENVAKASHAKGVGKVLGALERAGAFGDLHARTTDSLLALVKYNVGRLGELSFIGNSQSADQSLVDTINGTSARAGNCYSVLHKETEAGFLIGPDTFEFVAKLYRELGLAAPAARKPLTTLSRERRTETKTKIEIPNLDDIFTVSDLAPSEAKLGNKTSSQLEEIRVLLNQAREMSKEMLLGLNVHEIATAAKEIKKLREEVDPHGSVLRWLGKQVRDSSSGVPPHVSRAFELITRDESLRGGKSREHALTTESRSKLMRVMFQYYLRVKVVPTSPFLEPLVDDCRKALALPSGAAAKPTNLHAVRESLGYLERLQQGSATISSRQFFEIASLSPAISFRKAYNQNLYRQFEPELKRSFALVEDAGSHRGALTATERHALQQLNTLVSSFGKQEAFLSFLSTANFEELVGNAVIAGRKLRAANELPEISLSGPMRLVGPHEQIKLDTFRAGFTNAPELVASADRKKVADGLSLAAFGIVPHDTHGLLQRYYEGIYSRLPSKA